MKLEVGMYVRTKKGIAKIIDRILEPDHYYFKMWVTDKFLEINDDTEYISEVDVIKASYNIIDILEEGDYVNGYEIGYIDDCKGAMREFYYDDENPNEDVGHWQEEIKSVITHEQMEQIEYKVGE